MQPLKISSFNPLKGLNQAFGKFEFKQREKANDIFQIQRQIETKIPKRQLISPSLIQRTQIEHLEEMKGMQLVLPHPPPLSLKVIQGPEEKILNYMMFKQKFPHTFKHINPPSLTDSKAWYKNIGKRVEDNQKNFSQLKLDHKYKTERKSCKLL